MGRAEPGDTDSCARGDNLVKVKLNSIEKRLAEAVARKRNENNISNGVTSLKRSNKSDEDINVEGMMGEIAYCKAMNLYPDLEVDQVVHPSFDAKYRNGITVDVKTHVNYSSSRSGNLLMATLKTKVIDQDWFALVVGEYPEYEILGHFKSEDLIDPINIDDLGYGNTYVVDMDHPKWKLCL